MVTETIAADLIGGPASGRSLTLLDDRGVVRLPVMAHPASIADFWSQDKDPARPVPQFVATYRYCGIRDDGRRIYAYDARCSNA